MEKIKKKNTFLKNKKVVGRGCCHHVLNHRFMLIFVYDTWKPKIINGKIKISDIFSNALKPYMLKSIILMSGKYT